MNEPIDQALFDAVMAEKPDTSDLEVGDIAVYFGGYLAGAKTAARLAATRPAMPSDEELRERVIWTLVHHPMKYAIATEDLEPLADKLLSILAAQRPVAPDWVADVITERESQDQHWGMVTSNPHTPVEWMSILMKQVGQAAESSNTAHWYGPNDQNIRRQLIQIMAVSVAILDQQEALSAAIAQIGADQ